MWVKIETVAAIKKAAEANKKATTSAVICSTVNMPLNKLEVVFCQRAPMAKNPLDMPAAANFLNEETFIFTSVLYHNSTNLNNSK